MEQKHRDFHCDMDLQITDHEWWSFTHGYGLEPETFNVKLLVKQWYIYTNWTRQSWIKNATFQLQVKQLTKEDIGHG